SKRSTLILACFLSRFRSFALSRPQSPFVGQGHGHDPEAHRREKKSAMNRKSMRHRYLEVLLLMLLTTQAGPALAAPRTLYKPKNVAYARENARRYPWAQSIVTNWKS